MDIGSVCNSLSEILQIIGYILLVFKIAIPILIIALGMFDFGKAVVAEKEDEVKKMAKRLIYRIVAGVVIFFVPTIVLFLFGLISGYRNDTSNVSDFEICQSCILEPWDCPVSSSN